MKPFHTVWWGKVQGCFFSLSGEFELNSRRHLAFSTQQEDLTELTPWMLYRLVCQLKVLCYLHKQLNDFFSSLFFSVSTRKCIPDCAIMSILFLEGSKLVTLIKSSLKIPFLICWLASIWREELPGPWLWYAILAISDIICQRGRYNYSH